MDRGATSDGSKVNEGRVSSSDHDQSTVVRRTDVQVASSRALRAEAARRIVVVLGMHRSGTSLLSNILHLLGVDMADTTDHVSPKNPGGFWERPDLVAIHDEILEAIGRPIASPSHVLPFPAAWWRAKEVQALKPKLVGCVSDMLAKSPNMWGFKDPRTCRLLPLWWEVFKELNLEPIYVTAVRNPAEASVSMSQKSKVRKLSVANSELMWLSYNYDIARHVMAKSPTFVVDYQDWFAEPVDVARRLADGLHLGESLTGSDLAECVASVVHGEYRHQFEGKGGVTSDLPIATMLYEAISPGSTDQPDLRSLQGQLHLVDLFFKSLAPVVLELEDAAHSRAELEAGNAELAQREADLGKQLAEANEKADRLGQEHGSTQEALKQLEAERKSTVEQLSAIREALNTARDLAAQSAAMAEQRAALTLKVEVLETESNRLMDELSAARQSANEALAAKQAELEEALTEKQAALEEALTEKQAELEQALAQKRAELDGALTEKERELDETRGQTAAAEQEAAALRARQDRVRRRSRKLIAKAREWRASYAVESSDGGRLRAGEEAANSRRALDASERRLASAEEKITSLSDEIAARDRTLERLQSQIADRQTLRPPEGRVFSWPEGELCDVDGAVDRADDFGLVGHVRTGSRGVVPAVELRAAGALLFAQSCSPDDREGTADGSEWSFSLPWSRISPEFAGREAVLLISGVEKEIGRVAIPIDLREYHRSPAARAADALGGTVAEAAEYHSWNAAHEPSDLSAARAYGASRAKLLPRITVVVHGRGDATATLKSLDDQVHDAWEAICVGCSAGDVRSDAVRSVDEAGLEQLYAELPGDTLFTFVEAGDTLSPLALLQLADAACANPDAALVYSDEDRIDPRSGLRGRPNFKTDWSPDLALASDYVSRLALIRKDRLPNGLPTSNGAIFKTASRVALSGVGPVVHLPFVLYHRAAPNVVKDDVPPVPAVEALLADVPGADGAKVEVADGRLRVRWPVPDPAPRVSLIIPTRDRVDLLRVCVDGFLHETRYRNLEIVIVDNDSQEEETRTYLAKVATHPRVRVIPSPGPFNFSTLNNVGFANATGTIIGLMNNDLKVLDPDWLGEMVSHALRPDVGIVGAKLLHGDGTIQHAGVTLGIGLASHLYKFAPGSAEGRSGRLILPQDVSAVTAACLLMRREVWQEVGGLDEEFPVAYNDVDLCLKVRAAGYRVLWTPHALVYHLESQSRGKDVTPEKRERLEADKKRLLDRWGDWLTADPFHNPNLSNRHVDGRLAFPPRVQSPWARPEAPQ